MFNILGALLGLPLLLAPVAQYSAISAPLGYKVAQYTETIETSVTERYTGIASWYDYTFEPIVGQDGLFTGEEKVVLCPMSSEEWQHGGCWTQRHPVAAMHTEDPRFSRGDVVRVTNLANGKSIEVAITDTLEHPDRIIDLSSFAFASISDLKLGPIDVEIETIYHK